MTASIWGLFQCFRGWHQYPTEVVVRRGHEGQLCARCERFLGYGNAWPPLPAPWPDPPARRADSFRIYPTPPAAPPPPLRKGIA